MIKTLKLFKGRPLFQKIAVNTSWLFLDKAIQIALGLLVGIWVARYLGPKQFGTLQFASAFVVLFYSFSTLGLNSIVVRNIVREPAKTNEILGTSFLLRIIGSSVAFSIICIAIFLFNGNDTSRQLITVILAFTVFIKTYEVIKCWFESQVSSKYTVMAEKTALIIVSAIKIILILTKAPLIAFAVAILIETIFSGVGLYFLYRYTGQKVSEWKTNFNCAKELLKDSWPIMLSGFNMMIYMRIDQVMLGQMANNSAVGIYSVAVRMSEVWYFLPLAIATSVFPAILESKKNSNILYYQRLQKLHNILLILALSVAIPMTFLSGKIISFLLGPVYIQAGIVLSIHIWAGVFVFLGVASHRWYLAENLQKYMLYRTLWGSISNISLNLLLIPRYGIIGAAVATVISQALSNTIFNLFNKKTMPAFYMQLKAFAPRF